MSEGRQEEPNKPGGPLSASPPDASDAAATGKRPAGREDFSAGLGAYRPAVDAALDEIRRSRIIPRIWEKDYTVWGTEPAGIANRLGWLDSPKVMAGNVARLEAFADRVRAEGFTDALLLGMGGSSLAPEVFRKTFGVRDGRLDLAVLDSTDPGAVLARAEGRDAGKTLFIVSTKSGGTVETFSLFKFFYNRVAERVGDGRAGAHFVAITDPGSGLAETARRHNFREVFLNDPDIGGRYSALSYFGLAPAALVGVDLVRVLARAKKAAGDCGSDLPAASGNRGAELGAILGELARAGRDKMTLIASPAFAGFGDWVEQLIAESTGKAGKGILPVAGEPVGAPEVYGNDRLFVYLRLEGEGAQDDAVCALEAAGHPVVRLNAGDLYDLGGQFFLWEMATAIAGHRLGINPFDQPDVEAAKVLARRMVAAYAAGGKLPDDEPAPLSGKTLAAFLAQARPGDPLTGIGRSYIALQAYVQPTARTDAALRALRIRLREVTKMATTAGYGPRFLHSTGQLHKGDAGCGLFVQFSADDARDAAIPDEAGAPGSSLTFGVLKMAQALGDKEALQAAGRRVLRFHLGEDPAAAIEALAAEVS